MPSPYSTDLRERVVRAWETGQGTQAELAALFDVTEKTIRNWLKRKRESGTVEPLPMGGARGEPLIDADGEQFIREYVQDIPSITMAELAEAYGEQREVTVSQDTVRRAVKRLGFTKKKSRRAPLQPPDKMS